MIGRARELAEVARVLDSSTERGHAVLVEGDPGIGKTTFLDRVRAVAAEAGFRELRGVGVDRDTTLGYAALHEIVHPVLHHADALPARQRAALLGAFGLGADEAAADRLLLSLGALGLLEEAAARQPVVIVIDELHWIDRSSADVIDFLTRRLGDTPIVIVAAVRSEHIAATAGFARDLHLRLAPLSLEESIQVLGGTGRLDPQARNRVLAEANGNPLALVEFSAVLSEHGLAAGYGRLPTTHRLERAFLGQASVLPAASRAVLLLAATGETVPVPALLTAAAQLGLQPADLEPIERSGLITITGDRLHFRHPLIRSAVYGAASLTERAGAHRALAQVAGSDEATWHRADAALSRDESVARELELFAGRARQRGAEAEAAIAFSRAASLSENATARGTRLVEAAESARLVGMTREAQRAIAEATPLIADSQTLLRLKVTQSMIVIAAGSAQGPDDVLELVRIAEELKGPTGTDRAEERLGFLVIAAFTVSNRQLDRSLRRLVATALAAIDLGRWDPVQQIALAVLDPVGHAEVAALLGGLVEPLAALPQLLLGLAQAAEHVQDLPTALRAWSAAADASRTVTGGGDESHALAGLATVHLLAGELDAAMSTAEQVLRMGADLSFSSIEASASASIAGVHAWLGNRGDATDALVRARTLNATAAVPQICAATAWAAGRIALVDGDFAAAWQHLQGVHAHSVFAQWALGDLVEAAVGARRTDDFRPLLEQTEDATSRFHSPHMSMLIERSKALTGAGTTVEAHFDNAVRAGEQSICRLELARTHLLYGTWLRRHRKPAESRRHLTIAHEAFENARVVPLADRAARELRRLGIEVPRTRAETMRGTALLTPQERQVADLAATGLTNKEIADRIYLSHRTVGTHLSNAYAKLGLKSRVQLQDALRGRLPPP